VEFDGLTFGLEIVNFLVLVWILKRFLYRPVLDAIARRKAAIERTLADAGAKAAQAAALEAQYRDRLADWETEKQALRAQALRDVDAERTQRMAEVERAVAQERERREVLARRQTQDWRNRVEADALAQGAAFAARLLGRVAAPEVEARLVALVLEDLRRLPEPQVAALREACRAAPATLEVTSAFALGADAQAALARAFGEAAGAALPAQFAHDPALVAGVRARIGPWVMHANVEDELKFFAEAARHGA
jgi:F-type H+-transporting ATPase subunit b